MNGRELKRHWYVVRRRGEDRIRCLLSAFSETHIRRKVKLTKDDSIVVEEAKQWHISRVFSGTPVFAECKEHTTTKSVDRLVRNEFHTQMDDEKILVKIMS
jgi:hypothetical protein